MITASLGQLEAQLNAIFVPAPHGPGADSRFTDAINREIDRMKTPTAGSEPRALVTSPSGLRGALSASLDRQTVLGILEKYPPTNEGIRQAMPELQQTYPGVKLLEHPLTARGGNAVFLCGFRDE